MTVPAPVLVMPPAPEITPGAEKVAVPPDAAVSCTALLRVIAPVNTELAAVDPPMVVVPVLPACTVSARATVYDPLTSSDVFAVPLVLPISTADVVLPSAPALPLGALAPMINVPLRAEVVPV